MTASRIPDEERIEGVTYAATQEGIELPVIDVTHPSFQTQRSDADIVVLRQQAAAEFSKWQRRPAWIRRLMIAMLVRRSMLMRGLHSSRGSFVTGMNTYLLKLGPDHMVSTFAKPADREVAALPVFADVRLRLRLMSELLAEHVENQLTRSATPRPIAFVNLAGGPAMDSLNALILLGKKTTALASHAIRIDVFDAHSEAPQFGKNALASLQHAEAPLRELPIEFAHHFYDWHKSEDLCPVLQTLPENAVVAGSSEGGIFHYADDDIIRKNLEVLRAYTPADACFCGSLSPNTPMNRSATGMSRAAVRYFEMDVFHDLVRKTGWKIDSLRESLRTLCVRLTKA